MFGIGLGAFADGFERGYGLGQRIEEGHARREDREYLRGEREHQRKERDRAEGERAALDTINADTRAAFDREVQAGTAAPGDFERFWRDYALPRRVNELLVQGKVDEAQAYQQWGESADALAGGKLYSSAILKAQTGDPKGALEDAIKAAQIGGYMAPGDMSVEGQEEIVDEAGNLVGFRLRIKAADGSTKEQDIPVGDVPRVISTFVNPDAAYQSQVATRAAATKRTQDLEDYGAKKAIDAAYDTGKIPTREDAITALSKAYPPAEADVVTGAAADPGFLGWPEDKQNAEIEKFIRLAGGSSSSAVPEPAPASRKVVVDNNTGAVVGQPAATEAAPAMAPSPSRTALDAVDARATEDVVGLGLARGDDPQRVARGLMRRRSGAQP
jgi:hypothetical protein